MSIRTAKGSASTLPLKVNTPGLNSKCDGVTALSGGDRSSNNVACARRTGKRFMDGCLERGKAPNRNC
ncbi:MAG: hypothetical protein V7K53_24465 [Nostoc sp.]|uniref:hypothetical protein n=1 Tax=Nostoc sp. TaxID=1180 RepID=UPI002FFB43F4